MVRIAVLTAGLVMSLGAPAVADDQVPADGAATVVLNACPQAPGFGDVVTPGCSYIAIPKSGGGAFFAHLTSAGEITMNGTMQSGTFIFPGAKQTWPGISVPGGTVTVTIAKTDVSGTVAADGRVTMAVPYNATISAFGLNCTVKGSAALSSSNTDTNGGGTGKNRDAASGAFAVAGTSAPPATSGALCALAGDTLDLTRGIGWYFDGTLSSRPGVPSLLPQSAEAKLPSRIKRKGRTVLVSAPLVTNAGQEVSARVTWGTTKAAKGSKKSYARLSRKNGKVVLRTTGKARTLHVRLTLQAPASPGYEAYRTTRAWKVR
jgi:hypothetical protein